jgi:hypothetical protein
MTTKKILLIVAGLAVALGLVVFVFVGGIVGLALYQIGNSDAAVKAKDFLRASEKLKSDIGEVEDFGTIVTGSINFDGGNGEAALSLKVIGERKTVNASVNLTLVRGGAWRVSFASYVNETGQTISLLDPFDSKVHTPILIA